jgi:hypothetical protein
MNWFPANLAGTALTKFAVGLKTARIYLKAISGGFSIRNSDDSADAELTASRVKVSGNSIDLNSDAAGSAADWKLTLSRPSSGMSADVEFVLPAADGSPNQAVVTDGDGNLSFADVGTAASALKFDSTSVAFGTSSPVTMFSTGASDVIDHIDIIVDTAFNGTAPTLTVGISGTTAKYSGTGDCDLKTAGIYTIYPGLSAQGAEALIITYSADSSSAGAARVIVHYGAPS